MGLLKFIKDVRAYMKAKDLGISGTTSVTAEYVEHKYQPGERVMGAEYHYDFPTVLRKKGGKVYHLNELCPRIINSFRFTDEYFLVRLDAEEAKGHTCCKECEKKYKDTYNGDTGCYALPLTEK